MPVLNPVPSLQNICISITANAIIRAFGGDEEESDYEDVSQELETYTSVLPVSIRELLLHIILDNSEIYSPQIRYQALILLLSPQMKSLSVGMFPDTYYLRVSEVIQEQGIDLEYLNLRGVWLKGPLSSSLQKVLCNLKNLQKLFIPHMATDTVLEIIGENNGSLQVLDITGECILTEAGIESLCNSNGTIVQNLHCVLLGNPGGDEASPEAVAILIKHLPNLQSLGTYSNVGKAIKCLVKDVGESNVCTNLTHVHDIYTDIETMNLLHKTCTKLESIYFDHPHDEVISHLNKFNHLKEIKLHRFKTKDLYSYIEKAGDSVLIFELLFGTGTLDLSLLGKKCPNLVKLFCYKMDCIRHFDDTEFRSLKYLGIYYSDISLSCLKYIMAASPNIEQLFFGDFLEITDDDVIEIFTTRPFDNLTYIWFPNAVYLTSVSVQILIESCPKLEGLAEISGWNLTEADIILFKETIEANNMNLRL